MGLLIDTHYHMHPAHRASIALKCLLRNLNSLRRAAGNADDDLAAVLVACEDRDPFAMLWSERTSLHGDGITLRQASDGGALMCDCTGVTATLFPGRQYLSRERIEIIAFGDMTARCSGEPLPRILDAIEGEGAIPMVPWSPGRWTRKRGRLVMETLRTVERGQILLGEIALRPSWAPATRVHRSAGGAGAAFLYGTDPLPARGDESLGGRFVTRFPHLDAAAFTPALAREEAVRGRACSTGARNGIFEATFRYARHSAGNLFGS